MSKSKFKEISSKLDFPQLEKGILSFWKENKILEKYLKRNQKSKKKFSFLDGPITANNPMGVHHAWGRTLKDLYQRFKNMQGFEQRFQNGFDCQGLWVEVEVEKDLGFNSKKDIEKYGLDNFSKACKQRVEKYSKVQTDQSIRLGQWMDWDNSYYTFTDKNIEYIWYFLKKCNENGWLYKGFRSLPWCARCGTSLSQHELSDSYVEMTHESVFLKFPIKDRKNEYFLVWTTTPWTLAANVALAVSPENTYVKAKTKDGILILVKDLLGILKDDYQVLEEIKGAELEGLKYKSPFEELKAQEKSQKIVLLWEDVSVEEGTGIVHIAPGCGEEDFELGKKHNLAVLVPLDESGNYVEGYGELTGKFAHNISKQVFQSLESKDLLYKIENYTHRYPVCWRCKEPIVFRAEENWFISADEIRPRMIRDVKKVKWHPEYVGKLMEDWLNNMGDWNISRKRYYGLPLLFYECECGETVILGSKRELKAVAQDPQKVDKLCELHRPWIDEIKIKCPKCGKTVSRVPDVGDCWLDAGIVPFSTLSYFEDKKYWEKWFPADWISEMREQVRLWFYSTLFMAVTLEDRTPYLEVLSYEKVYDEKGKPMHKSAGNAIWFDDAAQIMGADVMRWLYSKQNPRTNLNFGYGPAREVKKEFLLVLWNCYKFFVDYMNSEPEMVEKVCDSEKMENQEFGVLDKWILSRLNNLIKAISENLENYNHHIASQEIQDFVVNDLSTWYIRRSRNRIGITAEQGKDKTACYVTLCRTLLILTKILAPFMPFLSEYMWQVLVEKDSVHLADWPKTRENLIDKNLEQKMEFVRKICSLGHAARKENNIKVRQALSELKIKNNELGTELVDLIKQELNVKKIEFVKELKEKKDWILQKENDLEIALNIEITPELKEEGQVREIMRQIQQMRREADYRPVHKISICAFGTNSLNNILEENKELILRETIAKDLTLGEKGKDSFDLEKEIKIENEKLWLAIKKIKDA